MLKIYECIGKQCAVLHFRYFGIDTKVEFANGNTARGRGAEYSTRDRFIQDAIENDSRFGSSIQIKAVYPEPEDEVVNKPKPSGSNKSDTTGGDKSGKGGKGGKGSKDSKSEKSGKGDKTEPSESNESEKTEDGKTVISSFKSVNDVIEYFKSLGENPESDEDINNLKEKYQVVFPEVKP